MKKNIFLLMGLVMALASVFTLMVNDEPAQAQDNLLQNPGFEEPYSGRGRGDFNIPNGWQAWVTNSPRTDAWMNLDPSAFPHRTAPEVREGVSLNIQRDFATFTVAVYQTVSVPENANVQGSVFAWLHTCGDPGDDTPDQCDSSDGSRAQVRLGIDPTGGTDPNSGNIIWSDWIVPHDTWGELRLDATAQGGSVTMFIYATQGQPRAFNRLYLDQASLTVGGEGGGPGAEPPEPTAPPFVAFVSPQDPQEDGSIVHTVQSGDTIASIAFAYGVTREEIVELNDIQDDRFIQIGQELLIKEADAPPESTEEPAADGEEGGESIAELSPEEAQALRDEALAAAMGGDDDAESDESDEGTDAVDPVSEVVQQLNDGEEGGTGTEVASANAAPAPTAAGSLFPETAQTLQSLVQVSESAEWSYDADAPDGPENWGSLTGSFAICDAGPFQSPIDITNAAPTPGEVFFLYTPTSLDMINDGNTVRLHFPPGSVMNLDGVPYELVMMTMHTPSEHAVEGETYDMEFQFYHELEGGGDVVISSVFAEVGEQENINFARFWDMLPTTEGERVTDPTVLVNPSSFLPTDRATYYSYNGSLTFPNCQGGIRWVLLNEPITISQEQLDTFREIYDNNVRPLQDDNNRPIELIATSAG